MRALLLSIFCLSLLPACTSPQERLADIESGMLALLGPAADLKIPTRNRHIYLPLPPPLEVQDEQKSQAQKLLAKAAQIDSTALDLERRHQLWQYRDVLTDLSGATSGWPLNPLDYTLAKPLQLCLAEADGQSLALLLEKMPDYYTEVEQRWQSTRRHNHVPAVQECTSMLDSLESLESRLGKYPMDIQARLRTALPTARVGLKNYLGQCRSLVLE